MDGRKIITAMTEEAPKKIASWVSLPNAGDIFTQGYYAGRTFFNPNIVKALYYLPEIREILWDSFSYSTWFLLLHIGYEEIAKPANYGFAEEGDESYYDYVFDKVLMWSLLKALEFYVNVLIDFVNNGRLSEKIKQTPFKKM